ncbi:hypothetical protein [Actinokineospora inagensis]|uniref:hypothetical protein n=1 Tax=Actinokineospora inagensis TaxID=103730 RepID=UPI00047BFD77|nr:hypothetical protein [Actinokineospora inagensis]
MGIYEAGDDRTEDRQDVRVTDTVDIEGNGNDSGENSANYSGNDTNEVENPLGEMGFPALPRVTARMLALAGLPLTIATTWLLDNETSATVSLTIT